jgi:hypothetical protein
MRARGSCQNQSGERVRGLKKVLFVLAAALATVAFYATPALAANPQAGQCEASGTTVNPPGGTVGGVTFTISGSTVTVSGGSAELCVKAGNGNSGTITLNDGESYTVDFDLNPAGQPPGISHLIVVTTSTTTTTTEGPTTTTTEGPTTTTTTTTEGPTTTTEGPTTTSTGGPTTTTGTGGVSGGTTGGTTGGTAPTGGELPFTGLPIWIPLLAAAGLLASGVVLVRRRKGELS